MKAVLLHQYGGPEQLRYEETEVPEFGDNEVLVRVRATSINPVDWKIRSGAAKARMPVEAITPAALFLVSEDAPTGEILSAVSGGFSRVYVAETETVFLPADEWTAEGVARFHEAARHDGRARYADSFDHVSTHVNQAALGEG